MKALSPIKKTLLATDQTIQRSIKKMFPLREILKCITLPNSTIPIIDSSLGFLCFGSPDTDWVYEKTKGKYIHDVIFRSFLVANQQFCFWYDRVNTHKRTNYTSGSINELVQENLSYDDLVLKFKNFIKTDAVTLRKERIEILNASYEHFRYIDIDGIEYDTLMDFLYKFELFHHDMFRKKANYFIMDIIRYSEYIKKNRDIFNGMVENTELYITTFTDFVDAEIIPVHMPAIDYQIPKGLRSKNLINITKWDIDIKIERGMIFTEDSTEELFIRSVSYWALRNIEKKLHRRFNATHEQIDASLFFNRNDVVFSKKIHLCKTTHY